MPSAPVSLSLPRSVLCSCGSRVRLSNVTRNTGGIWYSFHGPLFFFYSEAEVFMRPFSQIIPKAWGNSLNIAILIPLIPACFPFREERVYLFFTLNYITVPESPLFLHDILFRVWSMMNKEPRRILPHTSGNEFDICLLMDVLACLWGPLYPDRPMGTAFPSPPGQFHGWGKSKTPLPDSCPYLGVSVLLDPLPHRFQLPWMFYNTPAPMKNLCLCFFPTANSCSQPAHVCLVNFTKDWRRPDLKNEGITPTSHSI